MRRSPCNQARVNVPPVISGDPSPLPPPESPQPPVKRWRWWIHLLLIAAYPILIGVVGMGGSEAHGPALSSDVKGLLIVCLEQMIIFGVIFGLAWLASRATRDDLLWRWRGGIWPVPLGIGYSVALRLAVGLIVALVVAVVILARGVSLAEVQEFVLENRPDVESVVDVPAMRASPVYYWLTLTVVRFVLAGFREELWRVAVLAGMKTLWPRVFGSRAGQLGAMAVAAVIFGFGHLGQGPLAMVMTGLLGFGLGAIMVFHRSIWPAVIAHGMFNATSLAFIPWVLEKLNEIQR
jgi:membrane protease YdiL (CAAX protease family)